MWVLREIKMSDFSNDTAFNYGTEIPIEQGYVSNSLLIILLFIPPMYLAFVVVMTLCFVRYQLHRMRNDDEDQNNQEIIQMNVQAV